MKFGPVPIKKAQGAILAHSRRVSGHVLKKGHILCEDDIILFTNEGIT